MTQEITQDGELILGVTTEAVSHLDTTVNVILPPVVDRMTTGIDVANVVYDGARRNHNIQALTLNRPVGVLHDGDIIVRALGMGDVHVRDSHQMWLAMVYQGGGAKRFRAAGNEAGNAWVVTTLA